MDGKLRPLSRGQSQPIGVKVFNCASCAAPLEIRAEGLSQVCICTSCGTVLNAKSELHEILAARGKHKKFRTQVISLGTKGKLHGTTWQVIGYMERNDGGYYYWSEYLLFNPMKGFRWLAENNGHWAYVIMTKERPKIAFDKALYGGHYYDLYHKGDAFITYIIGEFYWEAQEGERVMVQDFIRGNEILSSEKSDQEIIWSVAEYIEADKVKEAFKIKEMPFQTGVAPNQPCPVTGKINDIKGFWILFLVILLGIQFASVIQKNPKVVYLNKYTHTQLGPGGSGIRSTEPFVLSPKTTNVQLRLYAPVSNAWLYFQGELVNLDTGEQVEFDMGVEYYFGYSGGEAWSEGQRRVTKNIPSVKGGTYQINFETSSDQRFQDFQLSVRRDVPLWAPFFWALGLLSLWPLILLWRRRTFNMKRWADSDFSPYLQHHEDE